MLADDVCAHLLLLKRLCQTHDVQLLDEVASGQIYEYAMMIQCSDPKSFRM